MTNAIYLLRCAVEYTFSRCFSLHWSRTHEHTSHMHSTTHFNRITVSLGVWAYRTTGRDWCGLATRNEVNHEHTHTQTHVHIHTDGQRIRQLFVEYPIYILHTCANCSNLYSIECGVDCDAPIKGDVVGEWSARVRSSPPWSNNWMRRAGLRSSWVSSPHWTADTHTHTHVTLRRVALPPHTHTHSTTE